VKKDFKMKNRPGKPGEEKEVIYSSQHWRLLKQLRARAIELMKLLRRYSLNPIVHGSIVRGDITPQSDIDIVLPYNVPSFIVEEALEAAGIKVLYKEIVQATPLSAVKVYIHLSERETVSFPLTKLSLREREFYTFGGESTLEELLKDIRKPGVNKRLMLVKPTLKGHVEYSIIGRESEVARILGISIDTVNERKKMLLKRSAVGRTGLYMKVEIPSIQPLETVIRKLISSGRLKLTNN